MLIPALVARLGAEVTEKKRTLAEHEAKATDATADTAVRQRANDAIVAQSPYLAALTTVRGRNWGAVLKCSWGGTAVEARAQRSRHYACLR